MQEFIDAYRAAFTGYIPCFLALVCLLWLLEKRLPPRGWKLALGVVLMALGIVFLIDGFDRGRLVGFLSSVLLIVLGAGSLAKAARLTAEMRENKGKVGAEGNE